MVARQSPEREENKAMRLTTTTLRGCAVILLAMTLAFGACGDDTTNTNDTAGGDDVTVANDVTTPDDTAVEDTAVEDTATPPEDTNVANPCDPNPCLNGGTCADDGAGNAACSCVDGYTGDTCETAPVVDPCDPNPCLNDGTCADDGAGNAVCTCADGFEGDLCADVALKDIVDTAIAAGSFTTLVTAVEAAGLVDTLKGDGPFTVFAPTDDAFAALDDGVLDELLETPEGLLTEILTYHVVTAKTMSEDVLALTEIETLAGATITVEVVDNEVILNGSVKITTADVECTNGVIHIIDAVLMPPQPMDIVDTAIAAGSFTTLVAAVEAAELVETLKGEGPFTVLAPTDDAFAALEDGVLDALLADPKGTLTDILTYHVASGAVMAADVVGLTEIETLNGKKITVEVVDGEVILNGSVKVTATDIECTNGVIHVIDAVLIPLDNIIEAATAAGTFTTMLTAIELAGFTETFENDGPYTVLAPTDDAFAALDAEILNAALADPEGLLTDVLTYHVADGKVLAAEVLGLTEIPTLNGKVITVEIVDGTVVLNGTVKVTATDIECSNGVIHVIDAVLLPPPALCEVNGGLCDYGTPNTNGLACVAGWGGQGYCVKACTELDASACDEDLDEVCITDNAGNGICGKATCTGFYTDDCGPGATCVVLGDTEGTCYLAGPIAEGEPCEALLECQMQLLCSGTCEAPACSKDGIKSCAGENEFCDLWTINLDQGTFPFDVGECVEACKTFVDDGFCEEGQLCVADWQNPLFGECEDIGGDPLAAGEVCDGTVLCEADHVCVGGTCMPVCAVGQGVGEVGGCPDGEVCVNLNAGGQPIQVGLCNLACDYHNDITCESDDNFCNPLEFSGAPADICQEKPEFWGQPGDACPADLPEYSYCSEGSFCYTGTCTQACFISEGPFGAGHPECADFAGTDCTEIFPGAPFGLCLAP